MESGSTLAVAPVVPAALAAPVMITRAQHAFSAKRMTLSPDDCSGMVRPAVVRAPLGFGPTAKREPCLGCFPAQSGAVYRKFPERNAGGGIDRVAQRRRSGRDTGFADAAGRLTALDHMHIDRGR